LSTKPVESSPQNLVIAYLLDRREQYDESSGIYHAIGELIDGIIEGEHETAHAHGDYDDLLADSSTWPWKYKKTK
jgi:hypothetical protein